MLVRPGRLMGPVGGGGAGIDAGQLASRFDGVNDEGLLPTATSGIADAGAFTGSMWFRTLTASSFRFFFQANIGTFDLSFQAGRTGLLRMNTTTPTTFFQTFFGTTIDDGNWHHIAWAARTSDGQRRVYFDGAMVINNAAGPTGVNLDLASSTYNFPGATTVDVDFSAIWMGTQFVDLSVGANLAKFISGGLPVDLGTDGSTPTGVSPEIYLPTGDTRVNNGSGGNGTMTGEPEEIAGPGA